MDQKGYSERQKREKELFNRLSNVQTAQEISFDPISGIEKRPLNPFWFVYDLVLRNLKGRGQRLLDFVCGTGVASVRFAEIGYEVFGFDISESNIRMAESPSVKYGLRKATLFSVQVAEELSCPNDFFDLVVGMNILHYVEIKQALNECFRVLITKGIAIFIEPIRVAPFDAIRNLRLVTHLVDKFRPSTGDISRDERKLSHKDLLVIRNRFTSCCRLDQLLRNPVSINPSWLEKFDYLLFQAFPEISSLGGIIVIQLEKN
jgi:SAM-dependent methyltransferase